MYEVQSSEKHLLVKKKKELSSKSWENRRYQEIVAHSSESKYSSSLSSKRLLHGIQRCEVYGWVCANICRELWTEAKWTRKTVNSWNEPSLIHFNPRFQPRQPLHTQLFNGLSILLHPRVLTAKLGLQKTVVVIKNSYYYFIWSS